MLRPPGRTPDSHDGVRFYADGKQTSEAFELLDSRRSSDRGRMGGVLVVEDCPDTRRLIERALGSQFSLRPCEGLAEARAALAESTPDLVILDIGLPDGDGMALCSELRSDEATRGVPVIFLSSRNAVDTKVTAFGLGADDFVDKPFNAAELRARVAARLRRSSEKDTGAARDRTAADRPRPLQGVPRRRRRRARPRSHGPRAAPARRARRDARGACSRAPSSRACSSAIT